MILTEQKSKELGQKDDHSYGFISMTDAEVDEARKYIHEKRVLLDKKTGVDKLEKNKIYV